MTTSRAYIITASTGIGAQTARCLIDAGHKVFLSSRRAENCSKLSEELTDSGGTCAWLAGDIAEPSTPEKIVAACMEAFGRVDGLYNVAGISGRRFGDGALHECTDEGWDTIIKTNLTSQFRLTREVVKQMLQQERDPQSGQRGAILNMSSVLGQFPEPRHFEATAYAVSKGAIITMTKTAAARYAKEGIRINAIAPGLVETPMSQRASENSEIQAFVKDKQVLTGGMIDLKDAAQAGFFLLTDASKSITGQVLTVAAGWELH